MSKQEAMIFLAFMVQRLGHGYHCDNLLCDYIDRNNSPSFTQDEINNLQPQHDEMMNELGDEAYSIAMSLMS